MLASFPNSDGTSHGMYIMYNRNPFYSLPKLSGEARSDSGLRSRESSVPVYPSHFFRSLLRDDTKERRPFAHEGFLKKKKQKTIPKKA